MPESLPSGPFQRVGFLAFVPALLRRFATEPAEVLRAADLDLKALENPENTIAYGAASRLLAISAEETQCPHFGLLLGQLIGTSSLGVVGELMRHAPTLGDALRDFAKHHYRNANGGIAYLLEGRHSAFFGYAVYQPDVEGNPVICDVAATAAYKLVNELIPPQPADSIEEIEVLISRAEPPDLAPYENLFGIKVHFNENQTAVRLPAAWLGWPVLGADPLRRRELEAHLNALAQTDGLDIVTRLRRELRVGLLSGEISGDQMAAHLDLNRRTLHRRLAAQGVTFQQIQDEVRCEFARQLLLNTRLGIGDIAILARYTEMSVFTRAFIRWTGQSPSAWRKARECRAG